jgi:hypothetical protein
MEPQALVVSLVCLSLSRVCWLSLDLVSSRLRADTRPPVTDAFVNAIPVLRRVEGCKLAPSLSPAQVSRCTSVNDRLAHVFAQHYLGFSQRAGPPGPRPKPFAIKYHVSPDRSYPPTLARRAPTVSASRRPTLTKRPSGLESRYAPHRKDRFSPRRLPLSKPRKARKLRTPLHPDPQPPRNSSRRVSIGGTTTISLGPRGWEKTPPLLVLAHRSMIRSQLTLDRDDSTYSHPSRNWISRGGGRLLVNVPRL